MNESSLNCAKTTLQCNIQKLIEKASKINESEEIDYERNCDNCDEMENVLPFTESNICIRVRLKLMNDINHDYYFSTFVHDEKIIAI